MSPSSPRGLSSSRTGFSAPPRTHRRDALAQIAAEDLGGVTIDEALRVLIFEHRTRAAFARLAEQPSEMRSYLDEAQELAEADTAVED